MEDVDGNCCCSDLVPIGDIQELLMGQHIVMPRRSCLSKPFYQHHAIVAGIEVSDGNAEVELIHFQEENGSMKIVSSTENLNPEEEEIYKVVYKNPRYSPEQIVQRARNKVNRPGQTVQRPSFANYNVLTCNCEHFCRWCVTNETQSLQVLEKILGLPKYLFGILRSVETLSLVKPYRGFIERLMKWDDFIVLFLDVITAMVESCGDRSHVYAKLKEKCADYILSQILKIILESLLPYVKILVAGLSIKALFALVCGVVLLIVCKKITEKLIEAYEL